MSVQIVKRAVRTPPARIILFGPPGTWKTGTLGCAPGAVGTSTEAPRRSASGPTASGILETGAPTRRYPDLIDVIRDVAADTALRRDFDWLMFDGLDDIEEQYLIPEALRRAEAKTLDENFFKPCNHLWPSTRSSSTSWKP